MTVDGGRDAVNSNVHELRAWLALHQASGYGAAAGWHPALRRAAGDARWLRREPHRFGLPAAIVRGLACVDGAAIEHELAWSRASGHALLTFEHPHYPPLLRHIDNPPPLLFACGHSEFLRVPHIAMVGSRRPSPAGRENGFRLARELCAHGYGIASGLARGIDTAVHKGALAAGGPTVAVAGTGLGHIYPRANRALAAAIRDAGVLLSEFPPDTPVQRWHFPRRNRLISGLSVAVVVVEADLRSGSLITAHHGLDQGRDVLAVPGSIHNPQARGCHKLLREGAALVEQAADVLAEIDRGAPVTRRPLSAEAREPAVNLGDAMQVRVYEALGFDPSSMDQIAERSGLTPPEVSSILLKLELKGYAKPLPGGRYLRAHPTKETE